jgi:crotonobetainyl-CoA hydratase
VAHDFVRVDREGPVTIVTLNRPEVMNALHSPAHAELDEVFNDFAADPEQWVAIVTGAGERAFSAGNDLKHQASGGSMGVPPSGFAGLTSRFDLDKPLIAAVNGVAMGGGFEIALACDILIATRRSRFGLPEPLIGAVALGGGMHRLARQVGLKHAMGLILSGDIIDAEAANRLGVITELVDHEQLEETVASWCARILRCAPLATRASKQTVMRGLDEASLAAAMRHQETYPAFKACYTSEDRHEGASAFAENRPPRWSGR